MYVAWDSSCVLPDFIARSRFRSSDVHGKHTGNRCHVLFAIVYWWTDRYLITRSDEVTTMRAGRPANGAIFRLVCAGRQPVGRFESLTALRENRYCWPGPARTNPSFAALRGECQRDVVFIGLNIKYCCDHCIDRRRSNHSIRSELVSKLSPVQALRLCSVVRDEHDAPSPTGWRRHAPGATERFRESLTHF
jgi:hypothetical protein